MIERYEHHEAGYNPFVIKDDWQVAKLNYVKNHGFDDLVDVEKHELTDEVFILFQGSAVLIECEVLIEEFCFELCPMVKGVVYNVPRGVWHNIAMSPDAQIYIVENGNTHHYDVQHLALEPTQLDQLHDMIAHCLI